MISQNKCNIIVLFFFITCCITPVFSQKPADLMQNCNQWKITYPNGVEDKTLCDEPNNEYFYVNETEGALVFFAPVRSDNGTTPNSSYIRSELREREADGSVDIYWTTEGKHMIYVKQAITHLPINKAHLVATQIHGNKDDGIDDSMVLRLEDSHLFLSFNGGKLREDLTIKTDYTLGTKHEVIFVVEDGKHYCYYSEDDNLLNAYKNGNADSYLVKDGSNDFVMDLNYDETYFKVGNYTQSNADNEGDETDNPENYGEVLVYDFYVEHDAVDVTGVTINPNNLNLTLGSTYQLSSTIIPENATNQNVTYVSNNTAVATITENGLVTPVAIGNVEITVSTEEGSYTDKSMIKVIEKHNGENLALNKSIIGTGTHHENNSIENLVDGNTSSRWSVSGFPQSATVDLGTSYALEVIELVCYSDRAYQYSIAVSNEINGTYTEIIDRANNTTPGTVANPILDILNQVEGRFVKITITGAEVYSGSWVSLLELRVFGTTILNTDKLNADEFNLSIWPNPAVKTLNIVGNEDFKTLMIYDRLGKLIINKPFKKEIDVSILKSGVYMIRLSNQQKSVFKKFIKK